MFHFLVERDAMLQQAYGNWSKRDYDAFIKASAKYGRDDVKSISKDIGGKNYKDVLSYHQVILYGPYNLLVHYFFL